MMAPKISAISEDFAFERITSSIGFTRKLPSPRLFGKLDTLEKPGDRCKGKTGRTERRRTFKNPGGFHPQALSRADLRGRPAGGPVRDFLRQGEEGPRPQPGRQGDRLAHRADRENHHRGGVRYPGRLARVRRAARRPRGEPPTAARSPALPLDRAADDRAAPGKRAAQAA